MSKFCIKKYGDDAKLKKNLKHDGSWGMDRDHMGEHGRWANGVET
jgi:hypothetical protein